MGFIERRRTLAVARAGARPVGYAPCRPGGGRSRDERQRQTTARRGFSRAGRQKRGPLFPHYPQYFFHLSQARTSLVARQQAQKAVHGFPAVCRQSGCRRSDSAAPGEPVFCLARTRPHAPCTKCFKGTAFGRGQNHDLEVVYSRSRNRPYKCAPKRRRSASLFDAASSMALTCASVRRTMIFRPAAPVGSLRKTARSAGVRLGRRMPGLSLRSSLFSRAASSGLPKNRA